MSTIAALLALLLVTALATPVWDQNQHAFTPTNTLADPKVYVYNQMPVDASLYLTHQRGDDSDTKGAHNCGYISAGDALDDYYPLTFETSTVTTVILPELSAYFEQSGGTGTSGRLASNFEIPTGSFGPTSCTYHLA